MINIRIDQSAEAKQATAKTIDRSGWGLLLIWVGMAFLAALGWGVGLLGVGIIMLGAQAARAYYGLSVDWFGLVLGLCFAVTGLSQQYDLRLDKSPVSAWFVPSLLIAAGVAVLVSAWRHRRGI